jgi:hypothetical protein
MTVRSKRSRVTADGSAEVETFLASFEHPMRDEVLALRAAILRANPTLTEHIKWNAPSFCHADDDRVTFRFAPKGSAVQLVFHRGAKPKDSKGFRFEDKSGLIVWAAPDRGIVTLATAAQVEAATEKVAELVNAWVAATAE